MKSRRKPNEKSEEAIRLKMSETTKLTRKEGSLLQPGSARKYVTVNAVRLITPQDKSEELQRKLYLRAKRQKVTACLVVAGC